MDNDIRKQALMRMKNPEGFDPVAFDEEGQMRVAKLKEAMQKGEASPDMGDSEDSPMRDPDAANIMLGRELAAYFGADGRSPASEEEIAQPRVLPTLTDDMSDEEMIRKLELLKAMANKGKSR